MTRLLAVELRRLFSRRLVVLAMAGALVATALVLAGVWQSSRPMTGDARARAVAEYERAQADWAENGEAHLAQCLADEERERDLSGADVDFGCDQMEPQEEWFLVTAPPLEDSLPGVLAGHAYLLVLLALLVGATFTAAEVSTGSLSTWLTFEPRRLRVYASKLLAATLGVLPAAVVLVAAVVGGAWLVADRFGLAGTMTQTDWGDAGATALRVLALTALVALAGAALGILARHTAGVLGAVVGYVVVVELVLANLLPRLQPWLLLKNVEGWVAGGTVYFLQTCTTDATGTLCDVTERALPLTHSVVYLLALAALTVAAGAVAIRRRDAV